MDYHDRVVTVEAILEGYSEILEVLRPYLCADPQQITQESYLTIERLASQPLVEADASVEALSGTPFPKTVQIRPGSLKRVCTSRRLFGRVRAAMTTPVVALPKPCLVNLKGARTYYWCTCGRSAKQPFCDGSHKGTDFQPLKFTAAAEGGEALLCGCKHTRNPPYCDGAHTNLPGALRWTIRRVRRIPASPW